MRIVNKYTIDYDDRFAKVKLRTEFSMKVLVVKFSSVFYAINRLSKKKEYTGEYGLTRQNL